MTYEMHIGEVFDLLTNEKKPRQINILSEDQFQLIEQVSDIELDENLRKFYKINKCRFTIVPQFKNIM